MTVTRATDPTLPLTVVWPIKDDNPIPLWLVPGDWSRGRAIAYVASEAGLPFIRLRAYRTYLRWAHLDFAAAGWRMDDGTLVECERSDTDAERYWTVGA